MTAVETLTLEAIRTLDVRAKVQELPALPKALQEISAALEDDRMGSDALTRKISMDPGLASRILRAANSPFYGMSGSISSVEDAVRVVGVRTIGSIVCAAAYLRTLPPPACAAFDFQRFWEHSFATAVCAQELAGLCNQPPAVAFTTGLLHDLGRLALATFYPRHLEAAVAHAERADGMLHESELAIMGIDHATVGAWIGQHWQFSTAVTEGIRDHHAPPGAQGAPAGLADIVHAGDGIVHALDLGSRPDDMVPRLALDSWLRLGLDTDKALRIFRRTQGAFEGMRAALL